MQNLQQIFHRFLDTIAGQPSELQLQLAMEKVIATVDLQSFAYFLLPPAKTRHSRLISNYPLPWTAFYLENRYQERDPVILRAVQQPCPFIWGPDLRASDSPEIEEQFFDEAAQFGLRHGLTIPIYRDLSAVAAITFAGDHYLTSFQRCLDVHLPLLQLIATLFHQHASRTLRPERAIDGVILSRREFECLSWAAQGKSAWEIGQILGISRRTAAFHLDNVRAKLAVGTVKQAVARFAVGQERAP